MTHQQQVLFGKRRSREHGYEWQLPGGWIESGESPRQAARRELLEETGLQLWEPRFVGITSNVFSELNHSISLYFEAECRDQNSLIVLEAEKCISWEWRDWAEISENLFLPLRLFKQTGFQPFLTNELPPYVQI